MAAMAVIAVECSGSGVNIQQSAEETSLMMGGGGEGVEAVAPSRAVLGDRQWGRQRWRQEGEHRPRGGGDRDDVSGAAVGGVVFLSAAVATTAPSSLSPRTRLFPPPRASANASVRRRWGCTRPRIPVRSTPAAERRPWPRACST